MPENLQWIHAYEHVGGLNTRYSATTTPIFDALEQQNIETIIKGGFRKINGYTRYVTAPILASGTYMQGTIDPTTESDPWTGAGDATTISFSGGVMTNDESAGATGLQSYYNAEAGFTTGTDAAYETRMSIDDGGTLSGVYVTSICVLDDGTDRFELVAIQTAAGTKQLAVLTTTGDRTVIGSYTSPTDYDWTALTNYRVTFDASGNVDVYVVDMTTAFITIAVSALPASTEASRVAFGSYETATVISSDWDFVSYKIGALALDTAPITGIYSFIDESDTQAVLVTAGTALYKFDSSTADWSAISGGTALTSGTKPHFSTWIDPTGGDAMVIITTEDGDTPQKYDGTARGDLGGSPPSGHFNAVYHERLFIYDKDAGVVYFSGLGTPEDDDIATGSWDTTNDLFLVDRFTYGLGSGLVVTNQRLLIFTKRAIFRLQGWGKGSFLLEPVTTRNGCVAPNSIQKGPFGDQRSEGVFFRDIDGRYWTDGQIGNVIRVSEKISTSIDEDLNAAQVANEVGFVDEARSLVGWGATTGTDTTNSKIEALDFRVGARRQQDGFFMEGWFPFSIGARAFGNILDSNKDRTLFSDHVGVVYRLDNGTSFDGADIDGYRTTSWIDGNAKQFAKTWRYMILYTTATGSHNLEVSWGINYQDDFANSATVNLASASSLLGSTFVLGTSKLGTQGVIHVKIPIDIIGHAIRFKFRTQEKAQPFTILGYSVGYETHDWFDSNVTPVAA